MLLQVKLLWAFLLGEDARTKSPKTVRKGTGAFIISSCCSVSHKSRSTPTGGTRMWAGGGRHSDSRDVALPPCLTRPHLQRRPTGRACWRGLMPGDWDRKATGKANAWSKHVTRMNTLVRGLLWQKKLSRRCPEVSTGLCRPSHPLCCWVGTVIRKIPLDEESFSTQPSFQQGFYLFIMYRALQNTKHLYKHYFLLFYQDCVKWLSSKYDRPPSLHLLPSPFCLWGSPTSQLHEG